MDDESVIETMPFNMVKTNTICKMKVQVMNVYLGRSATIHVILLDAQNKHVHSDVLSLTGDDYKAWGQDDEYIYTFVASKMGLLLPSMDIKEVVNDSSA